MVDDKGEVQITRKYVQSKKTGFSPSSSMQDDLKHFRKQQIRPICPPDNDNGQNRAAAGDNSRYSSMLNVSSSMIMDDHSSLNSADNSKMMTDINDNVELSDRYCKKEDTDAESFRNFDIWNSNLVPPLSPTDPSSLENHELSDKSLTESPPCDWTNNAKYWPPKTSSFSGYQYPSESGNPPRPCYNYLSNKSKAEQSRPVAVDAVRYQASASHQDQQAVAPYYRLHPLHPSSYLYPNDAASYSQSSMRAAACANYEHRWSRWCNGRLDATINSQNPLTLEKRDECGFHCDGKVMEDNTALSAVPSFVQSNYAPAYAPSFVLNFAPMYALNSNAAPRNATSRFIAAFGMASGDNEKRLRPILKQASDQL
ncbi:hypothetical protein HN011_006939 [Eciton burchellii]|nr:hypothetical protein HN011_006939 [Eciton burchellii]